VRKSSDGTFTEGHWKAIKEAAPNVRNLQSRTLKVHRQEEVQTL